MGDAVLVLVAVMLGAEDSRREGPQLKAQTCSLFKMHGARTSEQRKITTFTGYFSKPEQTKAVVALQIVGTPVLHAVVAVALLLGIGSGLVMHPVLKLRRVAVLHEVLAQDLGRLLYSFRLQPAAKHFANPRHCRHRLASHWLRAELLVLLGC